MPGKCKRDGRLTFCWGVGPYSPQCDVIHTRDMLQNALAFSNLYIKYYRGQCGYEVVGQQLVFPVYNLHPKAGRV